jgi:hypothetical protein
MEPLLAMTEGQAETILEPMPPMIGMRREEFDREIASAREAGATAQIARFKALGADPRAKGKMDFAVRLACEAPQMTADAIGGMCELTPASPARLSLAERSAETGAESVSSAPGPTPDPAAAGWDTAVNRANARTQADVKRARA